MNIYSWIVRFEADPTRGGGLYERTVLADSAESAIVYLNRVWGDVRTLSVEQRDLIDNPGDPERKRP